MITTRRAAARRATRGGQGTQGARSPRRSLARARDHGGSLLRETPDPLAERWLRRAQAGSEQDFDRLCARWRGPLTNFATSYCKGDATTAQDIVQETFITAWQKLDQIKDAEHFRPWLYRVARFKAINWLRKHHPRGRAPLSTDVAAERGHDVPEDGFDPVRRAMEIEPDNPWVDAVHRAIQQLPEIYIAVVRLHYMRRLTAREISILLQLNLTTVKMRLLRARELLKPILLREMGREP